MKVTILRKFKNSVKLHLNFPLFFVNVYKRVYKHISTYISLLNGPRKFCQQQKEKKKKKNVSTQTIHVHVFRLLYKSHLNLTSNLSQ